MAFTLPPIAESDTVSYLNDRLARNGPIWAAGSWNGANHIVAITGADDNGTPYVNDPAFASPVTRDMTWFNDRLARTVPVALMYLP